ncbi:MAG: hypothetical protein II640_10105, partial [Lachnospiraceae bacterium]|nr:hypothetical protein [Lachnospiraceae bacterium]
MNRGIRKGIAVLVSLAVMTGSFMPAYGMEYSLIDPDGAGETAGASQDGGSALKEGELLALFSSNGEMKNLPVLYDERKDILRVNPDSFNGYLDRYSYTLDPEEKIGIVTLTGIEYADRRYIAFEAGSSESWMQFNYMDSEHRLSAPAKWYKDELWVPADDFFHYIHSDTVRIALDGDETEWDPGKDFAVINDPRLPIPDLLLDVFQTDFGTNWFFDYKNDFGLSDSDLRKKEAAAKATTALHHVATADLSYMFRVGTLPITQVLNAISSFVMQEEEGSFARDYEKMYFEDFIGRMIMPSGTTLEEAVKRCDETGNALGVVGSAASSLAVLERSRDIISLKATLKAPVCTEPRILEKSNKILNSLIDGAQGEIDLLEKGSAGLGVIMGVGQFVLELEKLADDVNRQDQNMVGALQAFSGRLKTHPELNAMGNETAAALKKASSKMSDEAAYKLTEIAASFFDNLTLPAGELFSVVTSSKGTSLGAMSEALGLYGVYSSFVDLGWNLLEKIPFWPKMEEPEAFITSLYGIIYAASAYSQLMDCYVRGVAGTDFDDGDRLIESARLAMNYLKACLVVRECADLAYTHMYIENTDASRRNKSTERRISKLLLALSEAVTLATAKDAAAYSITGVPVASDSVFGESQMSYELFTHPSQMESGEQYNWSGVPLNAPERELLPLVLFDELSVSAHIGEYKGTTYWIYSDYELHEIAGLPVRTQLYDYIDTFTFYRDKLYYCCKDAGTSDYRMAICRCDPDGNSWEILAAPEEIWIDLTHFALYDNTLYYYYDANGSVAGFEYNGTPYYYQKNLQGDIVRICDLGGGTVAQY